MRGCSMTRWRKDNNVPGHPVIIDEDGVVICQVNAERH